MRFFTAASLLPDASTRYFFCPSAWRHRETPTAASYPANLTPPWKKYPTAVGPNPVSKPLVPSAATILRPAVSNELRARAGSIWIRVLTTSIAVGQVCKSSKSTSR